MEHEQLSYYEALKYLAKKYNIEIHEKELTDEEKQKRSDREDSYFFAIIIGAIYIFQTGVNYRNKIFFIE